MKLNVTDESKIMCNNLEKYSDRISTTKLPAKVDFSSEAVDSTGMVIFRYTPETNIASKYVVSYNILENGNILDRLADVEFEGISSVNPIELEFPRNTDTEYLRNADTDCKIEMQIKDEYGRSNHNSITSILRKNIDYDNNCGDVFALVIDQGEWFEYEVVDVKKSSLYGIPLQKGDRIRYEVVGIRVKHKRCFDFKNVLEYQVPLCNVYINNDKVAENIDATMVYPNDLQFWEEYQMIETNWKTEFAGSDLRYDSKIQFGTKDILIDLSFEGTTLTRIFVDNENGAVLDLERIVNMNGMQMSYHIVQVSSGPADISLANY